jgi:hypothetical protein
MKPGYEVFQGTPGWPSHQDPVRARFPLQHFRRLALELLIGHVDQYARVVLNRYGTNSLITPSALFKTKIFPS